MFLSYRFVMILRRFVDSFHVPSFDLRFFCVCCFTCGRLLAAHVLIHRRKPAANSKTCNVCRRQWVEHNFFFMSSKSKSRSMDLIELSMSHVRISNFFRFCLFFLLPMPNPAHSTDKNFVFAFFDFQSLHQFFFSFAELSQSTAAKNDHHRLTKSNVRTVRISNQQLKIDQKFSKQSKNASSQHKQ